MLANTNNPLNLWHENLIRNANVLPLATINHGEYKAGFKKSKAPDNSCIQTYQIVFDSILGIPVPQKILHRASRSNASIGCLLSISLFDIESGTFFGKTWKSSKIIPLIRKIKGKDTANAEGIDNQRAMLIGNKLNLELRDQCVYFHSHITSRHIVAVFETSFRVEGFAESEDLSGGWTILYLFDHKRGGLNLTRENNTEEAVGNEYKTAPLFVGTPRILSFISHTLFDSISGYSAMTICPGTSLKYYLIERPDIRQKYRLWKENTFLPSSGSIPGIKKSTVKGIILDGQTKLYLSNIQLNFAHGVKSFEDSLLSNFRDIYYDAHPNDMVFDSDGNLKNPIVNERRLYIGYHNSYEFISTPLIVTLTLTDSESEQADLKFEGKLNIDSFNNEDIPLVMVLEYKLSLEVNKPPEEKGSFAKLMEKFNSTKQDPSLEEANEIDQFVMLGYSILQGTSKRETNFIQDNGFCLTFNAGTKLNPMSTFAYRNNMQNNEGSRFINITFNLDETIETPPIANQPVQELPKLPTSDVEQPEFQVETENRPINLKNQPPPVNKEEEEQEELLDLESNRSRTNSIILYPPPAPKKILGSRKSKSRLLEAGFEMFMDNFGDKPKAVDTTTAQPSQLWLDLDTYPSEDIKIQLMGISFTDLYKRKHSGTTPDSVTFSFQFFTFPCFRSEKMKIYNGSLPPEFQKTARHQRSSSTPFHFRERTSNSVDSFSTTNNAGIVDDEALGILYGIGLDGRPKCKNSLKLDDERPGVTVNFNVQRDKENSENLRYGKSSILYYLWSKHLFIDMWDGESKFYLGQANVKLKHILRNGSNGVVCDYEIEISQVEETTKVKEDVAVLYLRIYNLANNEIIKKENYHSDSSNANSFTPKLFVNIDLETRKMVLQTTQTYNTEEKLEEQKDENSLKIQKILSLSRTNEPHEGTNVNGSKNHSKFSKDSLNIIQSMREMKKGKYVQNVLRKHLTTTRHLDVSLGQGYYIEYEVENPYESEQNLEIYWESSDLRDTDEILYFRKARNSIVEESAITPKFYENQFQIYLKPREKSFIPFYYQTFEEPASYLHSDIADKQTPKYLLVSIRNSKSKDLQYLELILTFKNYYIDKSFQTYYDENQILQRSIVEEEPQVCQIVRDTLVHTKGDYYMKCSNPNVNCSTTLLASPGNGSFLEIMFKFKTGAAIDVQNMFFVLYQDKYCSNVIAIWKVCIHTVKRIDVNCIYGQTNKLDLVIRGGPSTKNVICYPSDPSRFMVGISGTVQLQANVLSEIPLLLPPYSAPENKCLINIVECEASILLYSWLVVCHYSLPPITKSFDIQIEKGKLSNKRVSYTNPFLHKKTFMMRTDKPNLVQFKNQRIELAGGETQYIGLRFLPSDILQSADILIFMNNEFDEIEECLQINDQVKQLEKYCEYGAEQLFSTNEFLKVISNAELEYGKALLRAVKPYKDDINKLKDKVDKYPFYKAVSESSTSIKSWEKMLDSYESLGSLHVETAEIFLNERKLMKTTSKDIEKFELIKKGAAQLNEMIAGMEKNYTAYKKELKDLDSCTIQYKKSLKDLKMTKKDMDKIKMDYDKQILASQEAVKMYRESVIELNKFKNEYYYELLPQYLSQIQKCDNDSRISFVQQVFLRLYATSSALLPKEQRILEEAIGINDTVRVSSDHEALIQSLKTGLDPPLDFNIADTSEVHSKKVALRSSSRDELRLDYDSETEIAKLPDKQGKKKAMEKIKVLDKEIIEVEKQRQGVDILKTAYKDSENPLKILECTSEQLNDVEVKLNQLLAQKHKLHCYIANIDGKPLPEAPAFIGSPKQVIEQSPSSSSSTPAAAVQSHESIRTSAAVVQSHNSIPAPEGSDSSVKKLKVLYDFAADSNSPEEMSVNSGDQLTLIKENGDG
ncbi:Nephrocystin-4 [Terramyces sp. JEL0728]|nr:Nephrocystin-4 [Terramyces sp. JEL0728]